MAKPATPKPKKAKAPPPKKAKRKAGQPKRERGRPVWEPTAQERLFVELAVAAGYTQAQIGKAIGQSVDSLDRHCREELDTAAVKANIKVSGALFSKAMKGDVAAMIWWEKTRRGLRETSRHEHTGANGGPIETVEYDLTKLSEKELKQLESLRNRITIAGSDQGREGPASSGS